MRIAISYTAKRSKRFSKSRIERTVSRTLIALSRPRKGELSLAFVGDREIRKLNRAWLGRKGTTDVLSFPDQGNFLGEIIINFDSVSSWPDVRRLIVHGLLSLFGFDHKGAKGKKMEKLEEYVLEAV